MVRKYIHPLGSFAFDLQNYFRVMNPGSVSRCFDNCWSGYNYNVKFIPDRGKGGGGGGRGEDEEEDEEETVV